MNKVYIVSVTCDDLETIDGVYATHDKAREHARELAAERDLEESPGCCVDFWCDVDNNCVSISEHEVL